MLSNLELSRVGCFKPMQPMTRAEEALCECLGAKRDGSVDTDHVRKLVKRILDAAAREAGKRNDPAYAAWEGALTQTVFNCMTAKYSPIAVVSALREQMAEMLRS